MDFLHVIILAKSSHGALELVTAGLCTLLIGYMTYHALLSPLAGIPGPLSARLGFSTWQIMRAFKLDIAWKLKELHDRYGPLVRIGGNMVSVCDPTQVDKIYRTTWNKTSFYSGFYFNHRSMIMSVLDHKKHSTQRKSEGAPFTKQAVRDYEPIVDDLTEKLFDLVKRNEKDGVATLELGDVLRYYALDIMGDAGLGKHFDLLESGVDRFKMIPDIDLAVQAIIFSGLFPRLSPYMRRIAVAINVGGFNFGLQKTEEGVKRARDQVGTADSRPDIVTKMLAAKFPDGTPYDDDQVVSIIASVYFAGSDTSSILFRAIVYYVIKHPVVYGKLRAELDEAVAIGKLHFPCSDAEVSNLPYLQAVITESGRLHPATCWLLPREVPKGGAEISGQYIPAGTHVGMSAHVLHRATSAFGEDAGEFKPERWIDVSEEERRKMDKAFLAFSTGTRVCVGKHLALSIAGKLTAQLFAQYDCYFTPRGPGSPHHLPGRGSDGKVTLDEPWNVVQGFLQPQHDFWVNFYERKNQY